MFDFGQMKVARKGELTYLLFYRNESNEGADKKQKSLMLGQGFFF